MSPLVLGEFEQLVLLGILRKGSNAFSLRVREEIERQGRKKVSRGAFYTTLDRMEEKGLVIWRPSEPENPLRKGTQRLFSVTPKGIDAIRFTRNTLEARRARLDEALERLG